MRIQHNIAALNAHRQLSNNNSSVSKNLEKLSSGYKINRAGDDAAGLAISEKMRAQITGLETAQKNANDGISLVQTAEGALTEVHSMLNRMVELADQSANGTYDNEVDRDNLQKELDSLRSEIDRIADGTNFNGINLLDGSLGGARITSTPGVNGPVTAPGVAAVYSYDFNGAGALTDGESIIIDGVTVSAADNIPGGEDIDTATVTNVADQAQIIVNKYNADPSKAYTASWDNDNGKIILTAKAAGEVTVGPKVTSAAGATADMTEEVAGVDEAADPPTNATTNISYAANPKAGDVLTVGSQVFEFVTAGGTASTTGATAITIGDTTADTVADLLSAMTASGLTAAANGTTGITVTSANLDPVVVTQQAQGLTLQIGDTADSFNKLSVKVDSMSASSLGIDVIDITTQEGAGAAIQKIKDAINTVSSTRGDLGAIQNRLEHTINNLGVTAENMTAAESRIRDVDMAQEMMEFTKNNILTQASQAMLAQANQLPQGVLQLLQ